jgi:hypothetical protein
VWGSRTVKEEGGVRMRLTGRGGGGDVFDENLR